MNKTKFNGKIPRKGANIDKIYYPKLPEDVEKIVRKGGPILGMGLGNTHSRIDESRKKTVFISSERIKHIYRVNPSLLESTNKLKRRLGHLIDPILSPREKYKFKNYFINVGSGVTLNELSEYLQKRGLALPVTSEYGVETIGGASQTGTHGSGWHLGCIADYIVSMRVILPEKGLIVTTEPGRKISKDKNTFKNNDLFHALCCGIGSLGFVYDVIILVQDAVEYKSSVDVTKWLHIRGDMEYFVEDVRNLELFIDPLSGTTKVLQSGPFLKPFNYPKEKDKLKQLSGIYLSTESAIPIRQFDEIQQVINASLHYIKQKSIKCYPLHIRFGKISEHFLASTYGVDRNILGFVYIKMSINLENNPDVAMRDLTNFETFLNTHRGQANMGYIQGAVLNRPGILKWSIIYSAFHNNPFASDFAEEIAFEQN